MTEPRTDPCPVFRVILRMDVRGGTEPAFERAWAEVAESIAAHPANRGQWLMRGRDGGPSVYYVTSDWRDEPAFREFERSEAHRAHRSRLGPFRQGGWMVTAEVVRSVPGRKSPVPDAPGPAVLA